MQIVNHLKLGSMAATSVYNSYLYTNLFFPSSLPHNYLTSAINNYRRRALVPFSPWWRWRAWTRPLTLSTRERNRSPCTSSPRAERHSRGSTNSPVLEESAIMIPSCRLEVSGKREKEREGGRERKKVHPSFYPCSANPPIWWCWKQWLWLLPLQVLLWHLLPLQRSPLHRDWTREPQQVSHTQNHAHNTYKYSCSWTSAIACLYQSSSLNSHCEFFSKSPIPG